MNFTKFFLMLVKMLAVTFCVFFIINALFQITVDINEKEADRFAVELTEYMISEEGFGIENSVIDEARLRSYNSTNIETFYNCEYLYKTTITDLVNDDKWHLGSRIGSEILVTRSIPVTIKRGSELHQGNLEVGISENPFSYLTCMAEKAMETGEEYYDIPWYKDNIFYNQEKAVLSIKNEVVHTQQAAALNFEVVCVNISGTVLTGEVQGRNVEKRDSHTYFCRLPEYKLKNFEKEFTGQFDLKAVKKGDTIEFMEIEV